MIFPPAKRVIVAGGLHRCGLSLRQSYLTFATELDIGVLDIDVRHFAEQQVAVGRSVCGKRRLTALFSSADGSPAATDTQ